MRLGETLFRLIVIIKPFRLDAVLARSEVCGGVVLLEDAVEHRAVERDLVHQTTCAGARHLGSETSIVA